MRSWDQWSVPRYLLNQVLRKLSDAGIEAIDIMEKDMCVTFKASILKRRKISILFPMAKITHSRGLLSVVFNLWRNKTTLIALAIAISCFGYLKTKVFIINIKGDYPSIEDNLRSSLAQNGIVKYARCPDNETLKTIEDNLYEEYETKLEFLEVRRVGSIIKVKYSKRRTYIEIPMIQENLYATKDGIIKYFAVQSGSIVVKRNEYVKKGQLLVSDTLTDSSGKQIKVGSRGQVYANTWYVIDISLSVDDHSIDADYYLEMIGQARYEIGKQLTDGERIEAENILQFKKIDSTMKMKVHYTLLEDITI